MASTDLIMTSSIHTVDVSDTSSYQFNNPGTFEIVCQDNNELRAMINVGNSSENATHSEIIVDNKLMPLVYSHAAVMGVTFGVLLPIGAYMAYHYFVVVHVVIQIISIIAAMIGFVIIVTYVEVTHKTHFRFPIHGVVGLALILLVLIMPFLRLHRRVRQYHHKLGQIMAFFGIANVLLVSVSGTSIHTHYYNAIRAIVVYNQLVTINKSVMIVAQDMTTSTYIIL